MPGTVSSVARPTTEDLLEGLPELRAEHRVDDGVEGGVEVSEPEEEAEDMVINAVITDWTDESQDEERQPADDESPGDDSESFCCLFFSFLLQRNVSFSFLFLRFSLFLLTDQESALVSLTAGAGMFDGTISGGERAGE